MRKKLEIGVGTLDESGKRFVETWRRIQKGEPMMPRESLTFDDLGTLLRVLTPTRWKLLQRLRQKGSMSIRLLAQVLARDYKNVHTDVRALVHVGLVAKSTKGEVSVPWNTIITEMKLDAA